MESYTLSHSWRNFLKGDKHSMIADDVQFLCTLYENDIICSGSRKKVVWFNCQSWQWTL